MEFIFATNNLNKVKEINNALQGNYTICSLKDAGILIDIPEPYNTLEDNAREKAVTIYQMTGKNCFSEDTGLEVDALNGAPGVRSARYAGDQANSTDNMEKLLHELSASTNRNARFRTVICMILEGKELFFEGICNGTILRERRGDEGFGYDPIFIPEGSLKTFAQMDTNEKNTFSHRKKALDKMITYLNSRYAR
ncbi:MAG TPA: RdgB/HAM1 family non-canonical purine NTP pyrophosphatase [Ferruginibacter sp.]|nr:RdgB/HAM1 family non-canonical purine NTP pyrophosphatase [Ferruginibacter sp.]HRO18291.1 RdgB/HAM1 family non-canonical purine NTP pyrophosphatase [Ferruginibacter sp.]HRQ21601.1 RdgB/HAM1 family non-canonical purine NTP pyrophosphatase [Ferruginibacter sp.]